MPNNFREWTSRAERIQEQSLNSSSLWDATPEEELENIEKVKKQWHKKQHKEFKRIQHEESQNRNVKAIVSTLVTITIIAIIVPHVPSLWQMAIELVEKDEEVASSDNNKGEKKGFLNKLKALQEKGNKANQDKNANQAEDGNNASGASDGKGKGQKATIAEQLEDSVDSIDKYNTDLRKAMDMSDGKPVELPQEDSK